MSDTRYLSEKTALELIDQEPELPGEPPERIRNLLQQALELGDVTKVAQAMRLTVKITKDNIRRRFHSFLETPQIPQTRVDGLYKRYIVQKADGTPTDNDAEYFVLRLDRGGSDPVHIQACRDAIQTYAQRIREHLPALAADLNSRYPREDLPNDSNPTSSQTTSPLDDGVPTSSSDTP